MAKDILLELGLEEVPARFIRAAVKQLQDKTVKWLDDNRIGYASIDMYATPRRFTIKIAGASERQTDVQEEAKGPSRKIALDESGSWSKAAIGFARSQGVEPDSLFFKELNGVEYVYAQKSSTGIETESLLPEALAQIVASMNFPKNMRWGAREMKFVRPIRWIVALFGEQVIPLEIAGVKAGRITKGHRFLGGEIEIGSPEEYVEKLRGQFVIADIGERERLIVSQIESLAAANGWSVPMKEDLLEEVLFLVEYPTALFGTFDPDFLNIPQEVLITSMREHQRYFPVLNGQGGLLPFFVTVRNGNDVSLAQVSKGNEKVLRARLSDARFFYSEDQKLPIATALGKLETIVYHEELGTVADKVRRIGAIAHALAELSGAAPDELADVDRAAAICKFDLVTQMVYEFPELQGIMGEDYARKAGEREPVAKAVFEHYQPRFAGDAAPASRIGAFVSIADKIDTLAGCFSIGIIPTGSQDPYALRRAASGIVQILLEHKLPLKLHALIELALDVHAQARPLKLGKEDTARELYDFFALRVKNAFAADVRYDVVDAAMAAGYDDVPSAIRRGAALMAAVQQPEMKTTVEAFNRVNNLAAKAESLDTNPLTYSEEVETELYNGWKDIHPAYLQQLQEGGEQAALQQLSYLKTAITNYFDKVMVMADDLQVRSNRLGLLANISADIRQFADFGRLVW